MKQDHPKRVKGSNESHCSTALSLSTDEDQNGGDYEDEINPNLLMELLVLGGISATSFVAFVVMWLPFPVLLALLSFCASSGAIIYVALLHTGREIRRRGIADYLPESVYNQLTQTTLHDWMQDSSFTLEYRHLMLYFVPGISQEQLENFVDNLSPRHRYVLRRRGLGHLLGESFMRSILGNVRYEAHMQENPPTPTELLLPPSQTAIEGTINTETDLGNSNTTPVVAGTASRAISVPLMEEEYGLVSRAPAAEEVTADDLDQEGTVLADAMDSMLQSLFEVSLTSFGDGIVGVVERITPYIIGTGFGTAMISAGFAVLGLTLGVHNPNRRAIENRYLPTTRVLWSTGIFGGVTAGGMFLVRTALRTALGKAGKIDERPRKNATGDE